MTTDTDDKTDAEAMATSTQDFVDDVAAEIRNTMDLTDITPDEANQPDLTAAARAHRRSTPEREQLARARDAFAGPPPLPAGDPADAGDVPIHFTMGPRAAAFLLTELFGTYGTGRARTNAEVSELLSDYWRHQAEMRSSELDVGPWERRIAHLQTSSAT